MILNVKHSIFHVLVKNFIFLCIAVPACPLLCLKCVLPGNIQLLFGHTVLTYFTIHTKFMNKDNTLLGETYQILQKRQTVTNIDYSFDTTLSLVKTSICCVLVLVYAGFFQQDCGKSPKTALKNQIVEF